MKLVLKPVHHLTNVHEHGQSRTFRSLYTLGEERSVRFRILIVLFYFYLFIYLFIYLFVAPAGFWPRRQPRSPRKKGNM